VADGEADDEAGENVLVTIIVTGEPWGSMDVLAEVAS